MAHYAILNENNVVVEVIVGKDETELLDGMPFDWEKYYGGKRTSYNTKRGKYYLTDNSGLHPDQSKAFRKNYAGIGYTYDEQRDAFIPPKPYPSWILDEDTCWWKAPVEKPSDGKTYVWDEEITNWVEKQIF